MPAKPRRPRDPAKGKHWRGIIQRHQRSGLSVHAFCEREGLKDGNFLWWRRELNRRDREKTTAHPISSDKETPSPRGLPSSSPCESSMRASKLPGGPRRSRSCCRRPDRPGPRRIRSLGPSVRSWPCWRAAHAELAPDRADLPLCRRRPTCGRASTRSPTSSNRPWPSIRSRGTCSSSGVGAAIGSRSSTGTRTDTPCGTNDWRRARFRFPAAPRRRTSQGVEVKAADLMMILDGVDLGSVRRQRRYSRETVENPR